MWGICYDGSSGGRPDAHPVPCGVRLLQVEIKTMKYSFPTRWSVMAIATVLAASSTSAARADLMSACQADIATSCSGVPNGRGRISACLFSHSSKLDAACRLAVEAVARQSQSNWLLPASIRSLMGSGTPPAVPAACAADANRVCSDVDAGRDAVLACLYAHSGNVSTDCSTGIEAALK